MDEYQYLWFVEHTLQNKDIEVLFWIWNASLGQGKIGEKVRLLITQATPQLAAFHGFELKRNTFFELMQKYDDERVLQYAAQEKKYLFHFLRDGDIAGLKRVLQFASTEDMQKAVERLKTLPPKRALRYFFSFSNSILSQNSMCRFKICGHFGHLVGKAGIKMHLITSPLSTTDM